MHYTGPGGTATAATDTPTALVSLASATVTAEDRQMTGEPRTSADLKGSGGGHQTPANDERLRRRRKRRKSGQVGGEFGNSSTSSSRGDSIKPATWKPCAYRSLEWFNVPSRKLFLVDPSSVTTVPRPRTAMATATAAAAGRAAGLLQGVDIRPTGQKLERDGGHGDGGGDDVGGGGGSGDAGDSCLSGDHGHRRTDTPLEKGIGHPATGAGGRKVVRDADGVNTWVPKMFPPSAVLVRLPLGSATEAARGVESGSRGGFESSSPKDQAGQYHALRASQQQAVTLPKLKPIAAAETIQKRSDSDTVPDGKSKETCRASPSLLVGGGVTRSVTLECGPRALSPNERRRGCGGLMGRPSLQDRPRLVVTPQRPTLHYRAPYVAGVSLSPPTSRTRNISPCITPSCVRRVPPAPVAKRSLSAPVSVADREEGDNKALSRGPLSTCTVRSHDAKLEGVVPTTTHLDYFKRGKAAATGRASGARTCGGDVRSVTSLNSDNDNSLAASIFAPPPPRSRGDVPSTDAKPFLTDLDECFSINSVNSLSEWNRATA